MGGFYILVLGIEQKMVAKWIYKRSPGIILADLCSVFQDGAVGNGPGPNFGRKPAQNRENLYNIYIYINK